MTPAAATEGAPKLVFFVSGRSGACRRAEGFLAQVLQRRQNHNTFKRYRVDVDQRPDLADKFGVRVLPTICVLDGNRIASRIEAPRGCLDIQKALDPWLQ